MSNLKDILCDDMGIWKWNGNYHLWLSVDEHGEVTARIGKDFPDTSSSTHYQTWKRFYSNKSSPDVKKMVVLLEGDSEVISLVSYTISHLPKTVRVLPGYILSNPKNCIVLVTSTEPLLFVNVVAAIGTVG